MAGERDVVVGVEKEAARSEELGQGSGSEQIGSANGRRTVRGGKRPSRWLQSMSCWGGFSVLIVTVDGVDLTVCVLGDTVHWLLGSGGLFREASQDLVVELGEVFVARRE